VFADQPGLEIVLPSRVQRETLRAQPVEQHQGGGKMSADPDGLAVCGPDGVRTLTGS
jgi:hypothetical protein